MKYALIGCGRIAKHHINAAKECGLEIVALCDLQKKKLKDILVSLNFLKAHIFILIIKR